MGHSSMHAHVSVYACCWPHWKFLIQCRLVYVTTQIENSNSTGLLPFTHFRVGLDCIFHLRGEPYSRWTFFVLHRRHMHAPIEVRSLAADYPIWKDFYHTQVPLLVSHRSFRSHGRYLPALRASPNNLTHSRLLSPFIRCWSDVCVTSYTLGQIQDHYD